MGQPSLPERPQWEEVDSRPDEYGRWLHLRRDSLQGNIAVVALSTEGIIEIVHEERALHAYFHPNVTPGLEGKPLEDSRWDIAFDAFNRLGKEDKQWALMKLGRFKKRAMPSPTVLEDIVRHQQSTHQLERGQEAA